MAFLESFLSRVDEEKGNNPLAAFYDSVTQEFVKKWDSPVPPDVDTKVVTDPVVLKALSDARRGRVSFNSRPFSTTLTLSLPANHGMVQKEQTWQTHET